MSVRLRSLSLLCLLGAVCLSDVWAQQLPPPPLPPPPITTAARGEAARVTASHTGSISGRVLDDDGSPAANVTVGLVSIGLAQPTSRATVTDGEGNFTFRDLPARSYRLTARSPGYVSDDAPLSSSAYRNGDTATLNLVKGGVITGRVLNAAGEPVIAVHVMAIRVRDAEGRPIQSGPTGRAEQTDDLGVYRIYGLRPGAYLIVAGGYGFSARGTPYEGDAPVYYPSSTRDTANEVVVTTGSVASGIDLRYRAEPGHIISGKVGGTVEPSAENGRPWISLTLRQSGAGAVVANSYTFPAGLTASYEMRGVPDGEYEIAAYRIDQSNAASSPWRQVLVRGADVNGVDLALAPLASLAGRIVLEPAAKAEQVAKCTPKRQAALEETLLRAQWDEAKENFFATVGANEVAPDDKGAFTLYNLQAGRYRLLATPPGETWYVKAIAANAASTVPATAGRQSVASSANLFSFRAGDKVSGVTVTLAEGAASLQGQVVSDNAKTATRLRMHLLPADPAAADDVLRYYETLLRHDGTFNFKQLAPGKYWLLARPISDDESYERPPRPLAWDQTERLKLRREAEAIKQEIELTTCQRQTDVKLQYKGK